MRSCILCKFWGSSKTISGHKLAAMLKMPPPKDSSETIWYIGLKFSGITEINSYSLSIFRNFNLLASSDNDKPTLMRQKCKQGFVYTLKGKLAKTVEVASKRGPQCKWRKRQSYPKVDSKIYSDTLLVLFLGHCDTVNGNRLAGVALIIRELTNWRLSHEDAVGLREWLTAHAYLSTCRRRVKVEAVVDSDSPAS